MNMDKLGKFVGGWLVGWGVGVGVSRGRDKDMMGMGALERERGCTGTGTISLPGICRSRRAAAQLK